MSYLKLNINESVKISNVQLFVRFFLLLLLSTFFVMLPVRVHALYPYFTTSSSTSALAPNHMRPIVKTSDGVLHAFIQLGTQTADCGGTPTSGLIYFRSADSGTSFSCVAQISSDTTNLMFADAAADSSDNIYVTYSTLATTADTNNDVYYRKVTSNGSSTWTVENAQKVVDSAGAVGYSYSSIALQGTTRAWIAFRYFDGTNYQVSAFNSDTLGAAPTWTLSKETINTKTTRSAFHQPVLVRYGSNIGLAAFADDTVNGQILFWTRRDSHTLTYWYGGTTILGGGAGSLPPFSITGDADGKLYSANISSGFLYFKHYDSISWKDPINISTSAGSYVNVATDGSQSWTMYTTTGDITASYETDLPSRTAIVYKKGLPPYSATSNFDTTATRIDSQSTFFDKVWLYDDSAVSKYQDDTTDALDAGGTSDVAHPTSIRTVKDINDVAYFGKSSTFNGVSYSLGTNGAGGANVWEYCSAVDGSNVCTTWTTITPTSSSAPSLTADGWIAFTVPGNWVANAVNGEGTTYYYVRLRVTTTMTTGPYGKQFMAQAPITHFNSIRAANSNTVGVLFGSNPVAPARIHYTSFSPTTLTATTSTDINPKVIAYSALDEGVYTMSPNNRQIVKTSDGTLHAMINVGSASVLCGGTEADGIVWFKSSDSGSTWVCGSQLFANNNLRFTANAYVDSLDNIFVTYGSFALCNGVDNDIYYRKIVNTGGSNWAVGAEQKIYDGDASLGYNYPTISVEGTSKVWVAARSCASDGSVTLKLTYADPSVEAPAWNEALASAATGLSPDYLRSSLIRYGSSTAVIYEDDSNTLKIRTHADSDAAATWAAASTIVGSSYTCTYNDYSVIGTPGGKIFVLSYGCNDYSYYFTYYNSSVWSGSILVSNYADASNPSGVSYDASEKPVIVYTDDPGDSTGILPSGRMYLRKLNMPLTNTDDIGSAVPAISTHRTFDSVYKEVSGTFTDVTTAASDGTGGTNVTSMFTSVNDSVYFGDDAKFDTLSLTQSTRGTVGKNTWEYYNGNSWVPIQKIPFAYNPDLTSNNSSRMTFVPPDDWTQVAVSDLTTRYYIRQRVTSAYTTKPVYAQAYSFPSIPSFSMLPMTGSSAVIMYSDATTSTGRSRIRYSGYDMSSYPAFTGDPAWDPDTQFNFEGSFPPTGWTTSGPVGWSKNSEHASDGSYSAKSGAIANSEESVLTYTVNLSENKNLRFHWKVSSESGYDYAVFCVNNEACTASTGYDARITGEKTAIWNVHRKELSAGVNTLTWKYIKDSGAASGSDAAWLDNVDIFSLTDPNPGVTPTSTSTPTPTPTTAGATPTPTPTGIASTPTPTSAQILSSSTSSTSSPAPVSCMAKKPDHAPDLFQIDPEFEKAVLFLTPLKENVDHYFIAYGLLEGDNQYGTQFNFGPYTGVIDYTVKDLDPGQTYYFRVRAGNGCALGDWSNTYRVTMNGKNTKTVSSNIGANLTSDNTEKVDGTTPADNVIKKNTVTLNKIKATKENTQKPAVQKQKSYIQSFIDMIAEMFWWK